MPPKQPAAPPLKRRASFGDVAFGVFQSMKRHQAFPHTSVEDVDENTKLDIVCDQTTHSSYKLAFADHDFLLREDMRSTRLALEYTKVETCLREQNVHGTIVCFGSARLKPGTEYYEHARELAKLIAIDGVQHGVHVMSGGGPGIMEAANRGAHEVGAKNVGLNIVLPYEQRPNPYITPSLCFSFHYFSIRKMHLLLRAKALIAFPGGFGTLDELFETLTLVQTGKMDAIPIVLFGTKFWKKIVNFDALLEEKVISESDLSLFQYADTPTEVTDILAEFYKGKDLTTQSKKAKVDT